MKKENKKTSTLPAKYGSLLVALAVLVSLALPASLMAQDTGKTDQWQFMIEPYLWTPGINTIASNGIDVGLCDLVAGYRYMSWDFKDSSFQKI